MRSDRARWSVRPVTATCRPRSSIRRRSTLTWPRAAVLGSAAAVLTAVLAAAFNAWLNLLVGVAIVAALGGWLIGRAVRQGAWSGELRTPTLASAEVRSVGTPPQTLRGFDAETGGPHCRSRLTRR